MVIQIVTTFIHALLCYIFIHKFEFGLAGTGLAMAFTSAANFIVTTIYISYLDEIKEAWFLPNKDCFQGLGNYMKLGFQSTVM